MCLSERDHTDYSDAGTPAMINTKEEAARIEAARVEAVALAACARARAYRAKLPRIGDELDPDLEYLHVGDGYLLPIGP